jgi:SAM-dependent methyltransferase
VSSGSGRGAITADGCAVEVYLLLPPMGEAEIIAEVVPPGASILDLGCGTGRIAHELLARGYAVVGVDQSADMLAHTRGFETVEAPIAGLHLDERFDAVLLASNLVNTPEDEDRRAILAAAAEHVAPGGVVLAQWEPPEWFERVDDGAVSAAGPVQMQLVDVHREGDLLSATVRYWAGDELWTHAFTTRRFDDEALRRELRGAGLSFDRYLCDDRSWFAARGLP